jgi:hypothetical protein
MNRDKDPQRKGGIMQTARWWIGCLIVAALLLSGCAAAVIGGAAMGVGSGTYYYMNGTLEADYSHSFDETWEACRKTVADLRGLDVLPDKKIAEAGIKATIDGARVQISVTYKARNVTTVAVRVGWFGNERSSRFIQDRIGDNLAKKEAP